MSWTSDNYSYTKEEIQPTAYAAGCGKGWFWIHKLPNMFIKGYINDDGTYNLTFYKPRASLFTYSMKLTLNGKTIFSFTPSQINNKVVKVSASGSGLGEKAVLKMYCGDVHCDNGAGSSNGKVLLDLVLYKPPKDLKLNIVKITGTTIITKPTWTAGNRTNTATIICNGISKTTNESGEEIKFSKLKNNTKYKITCSSTDGKTKLTATTQNCLTYGVLFSNSVVTTNSASILAKCNYGAFDLSYKSETYNLSGVIKNNTKIELKNLKYIDGGVKIKCWIKDIPDAVSEITLKLTRLILKNTHMSANQFDITTKWQAILDNGNNIDNNISFSKCNIYLGDKLINKNVLISANYKTNKSAIFGNLQSYTLYKIECSVTDGVNESNIVTLYIQTLFPYVRIYKNNKWLKAIPYVYIDNEWKKAKLNIFKDKKWHECSSK